ncbi:MAG: SPOR domain-containing protein [Acidobacteriota bacterium]
MSREPELYKDKIEVSLDGRQIFYLFFGGSVIVALVFVLGVMVGRRVEARGHVERAHVEAAVDPLAALDRLEGGAGLSFQGTLRGAQPPATEVEKKIAELAPKEKEKAEKKLNRQDAEVAKPEAKIEPKVEAKLDKKDGDKKDGDKKDGDRKDGDKHAEADRKDKDGDKKADAAKRGDGDKHADADSKDDRKVADKKDGEKKPKFTLQLSSFQDKAEADAYMQSVKQAGFQPYVTQGDVDGKQFYRVRLGSYRSIDAANDAKAEFEKAAKKSALVTKL